MPEQKSADSAKQNNAEALHPASHSGKAAIVSSAHLASGRSAELSEFEFGMIIASNAFNRWAVRCMTAAGVKDMTITDALKKLQALGLVKTEKRGKEVLYSTNEEGQALCQRYYEIREQVLVSGLTGSGTESFELSELARFLRVLSGLYEQAARAATSL